MGANDETQMLMMEQATPSVPSADAPSRIGYADGWYVVARLTELSGKKPIRRWLNNRPLVLFLVGDEPQAFVDFCPHRGAPLSDGRIVDGKIECPYHGWQFNHSGELQHMPCLVGDLPAARARKLDTAVVHGLVFVASGKVSGKPYANEQLSDIRYWRPVKGEVRADMADALENFLDPTHTIFVHRQLVRSVHNSNRTKVRIVVNELGAEAQYLGEGQAGGLVAAMMREKERVLSVGRYVFPNIAEVEFHGTKGVNFVMTGYMTPTRDGLVEGYGLVGLPGPRFWARFKFWLLYPLIKLVHRQDQKILQNTQRNNEVFGNTRKSLGPLDLLRPLIDALLAGRRPLLGEIRNVEMDL